MKCYCVSGGFQLFEEAVEKTDVDLINMSTYTEVSANYCPELVPYVRLCLLLRFR